MLSFGLMTIGSPFQSKILDSPSAPRASSLAGSAAAPLLCRLCGPRGTGRA